MSNNKQEQQQQQQQIPKKIYNNDPELFGSFKKNIDNGELMNELFGHIPQDIRAKIAGENIEKPLPLLSRSEPKAKRAAVNEELRIEKLKRKKSGSKKKREMNFFDIPIENQIYDQYLPLHDLWSQYIKDVIQNQKGPLLVNKIIKSDLHGSIIQVVRSKCPSYIGKSGIVIQETENTFKLITRENRVLGMC
eukprot:gene6696-8282_t